MHHDDAVEALLPAYAADELDAPARAGVDRALAHSAPLRRELRRYRQLFALLAAAAAEHIAPDDACARCLRHRFAHRGAATEP
jgi:anti-sigma factor RsiW